MKRWIFVFMALALPLFGFSQELIERVDIIGNERVTRDTVMYYLTAREGDPFSDELLKRDFRVLWTTGFFSDIKIENEKGERGRIIKIHLTENPVVKEIRYKAGKKVKEEDIVGKLKEKDEYVLPYAWYSPYKIQKIKATIEDLLAEKGLHAAKVTVDTTKKGKSELEIEFKIDEGPKVRVGEVVFSGSPKLLQSVLREGMKENQKYNLFTLVSGKSLYKQNKLSDDVAGIKKKLQENGYLEATVGEPKIEDVQRRPFLFFKKQPMMKVVIPVNAGYRYVVGKITLEGTKVFSAKALKGLVKLKEGEVYNVKLREKSLEDIGEVFRNYGHLYGQVIPVENLDPKNKIVNVVFNVVEGDVCYLRRLDFKGNIYTKDKVIRREMLVAEGDPFRFNLFKDSVLRVKQLGLVDLEKDPDVKPDPKDPTQFDVTVPVKELQRNNIQFTAGYSGYEGTFVALTYSTVNFLGAGENLEITAQYGKRIRNYVFGFTEPYLFDYPINVGFNIYNRYVVYPFIYNRMDKGIDLSLSARIIGYWRGNVTYSYQNVNISQPDTTITDSSLAASSYYGSYYDPYYSGLYGWGRYNMSSITPSIYRTTVDSPLTPSSGTMYLASLKYAGSFLGGEIDMVKPHLEFTHFQPTLKDVSLGFHIEYSSVKPIGHSQVPFWERFFLGGERNIRGYEIYSIGPRSEQGTNIGGLKSFVMNAECIIHLGGQSSPLYVIAFHDRGNAYSENEKVSWKNMYTSTGLEARIFVPALRVPFRLIFSYNNRRIYTADSNFAFRFAIGTTF